MGRAADWLREERRKVLGDWVAFCLRCGAARRWFEEFEAELPDACPQCGHVSGMSASNRSNQRRAAPHVRQNATQSPSTLRRSSRSQSEALPIR